MLGGLQTRTTRTSKGWVGYSDNRDNYKATSIEIKRQTVARWIQLTQPDWVADLGANTGEFSFIAAEAGAQVVALDSDHDAVQQIFNSHPARLSRSIHPIIATLDDLNAGRGWGGSEFAGLSSRLNRGFDLVLMLAILHHLAIAASIPLSEIAAFAARCTRRFVIVELIDSCDPQLIRLVRRYGRTLDEFSLSRQRAAFLEAGFVVEAEVDLEPTPRRLLLLRL
jgi:SAM-dependent methyltransferase